MRTMITGIILLFMFAMACGISVAVHSAEGLVENDYFARGDAWFRTKAEERRLGLEISAPATMTLGSNDVRCTISEHDRPLSNANVTLCFGSMPTGDRDFSRAMKETSPGVYQATVQLPSPGKWLVRLELDAKPLHTTRSWFYDVK